jgi:pseudouridine-5'-phosphate glycosidase/pseudouridine kinase
MVLSALEAKGMDTSGLRVLDEKDGARTAQYIAVNDANKDLMVAMADFRILSSGTAPTAGEDFAPWQEILDASTPEYVVVDANWSPTGFWNWVHAAKKSGAKVIFEPVSVAKSTVLFPPLPTSSKIDSDSAHDASTLPSVFPHHTIDLMTPNQYELVAMHDAAKTYGYLESQEWWTVIDSLGIPSSGVGLALQHLSSPPLVNDGIPQRMLQLLPFCPLILTKLGPAGVLLARLLPSNHPLLTDPAAAPYILSRCRNSSEVVGGVYMRLFGPVERVEEGQVVSVNGVGDTFAGVLVAGLARGGDVCDAEGGLIGLAQRGAVMSLRSGESVAPEVRGLRKRLEGLVPRRR